MGNSNAKLSKWDEVYGFLVKARKTGITADEIVQRTGYSRHTVSSYLTLFYQNGYARKTDKRRKITSGRTAVVYVAA
jgi:DNA-binding IclR family transcriptional regulator